MEVGTEERRCNGGRWKRRWKEMGGRRWEWRWESRQEIEVVERSLPYRTAGIY